MWSTSPNEMILNIFRMSLRCLIHLNHKRTYLALKVLICEKIMYFRSQNQHSWKYGPDPGPKNVSKELRSERLFSSTSSFVLLKDLQFNTKKIKNWFVPPFFSIHTSKSWTQSGSNALEPNTILKTTSNGLFERSNFFFRMSFIFSNTKIWGKKIK